MFLCWDKYLPSLNSLQGKTSLDLKVHMWFQEHHWAAALQIALNFFPWKKYLKISWEKYSYALFSLGLCFFSVPCFQKYPLLKITGTDFLVFSSERKKANYHSSFYRSLIHTAKLLHLLLPSPLFQNKLAQICLFFFSKLFLWKLASPCTFHAQCCKSSPARAHCHQRSRITLRVLMENQRCTDI